MRSLFGHFSCDDDAMADTSRRMLRLLTLLQTGRAWSGAELAGELGTSPRSLRRDVTRLRELGYPVEAPRGPGGHYRLAAGSAMPPLLLDDEETVAIAIGLQLARAGAVEGIADAAAQALRKVEQVLPQRLSAQAHGLLRAVEAAPPSWPGADGALLTELSAAAARHERVRLRHRRRDGGERERIVEPHRVVLLGRRWYLLAWDAERDDWRTFRLDRVERAQRLGQPFRPRPLPAERAVDFLRERFDAHAPEHLVVVTFHASVATVAERLSRKDGALEPLGDDRCRYSARVDSYEWMAVVLALAGLDYTIERPAAFAARTRELARRMTAAAQEPA